MSAHWRYLDSLPTLPNLFVQAALRHKVTGTELPIIGLLLLLGFLVVRGQVSEPLSQAASGLLRYLPLLLVPPAVGVMVYAADIAADFWAIVGALVLSLLISKAFVGALMQRLLKNHSHTEEQP